MTPENKLLIFGLGGATLAALCCFTPVLVVVLGALGLSAWLGWLDYVLLPTLGLFVLITFYALYRRLRRPATVDACCSPEDRT